MKDVGTLHKVPYDPRTFCYVRKWLAILKVQSKRRAGDIPWRRGCFLKMSWAGMHGVGVSVSPGGKEVSASQEGVPPRLPRTLVKDLGGKVNRTSARKH
jgi:hypothetical protein